MPADFTYDVFLSYNSNDKPRVRKIAERLRDAGLRVCDDPANERGLEASRVQALCLSPAALGSDWVMLERSTVPFREAGDSGRRFVLVLLADCELPDSLRRYKYVDLRGEPEAALEELLSATRPETESPPPVPRLRPKPVKPADEPQPLAVLECELTGHDDWVRSVAVSLDGTWAVSGSDDRTVKIWSLESGECRATLEGHTGWVHSVAIMPDGERILSGSDDDSVRIWDARDGKVVAKWQVSQDSVLSVAPLPDGRRVISSGGDGTVRIWDAGSRQSVATLLGHTAAVWSGRFRMTGNGPLLDRPTRRSGFGTSKRGIAWRPCRAIRTSHNTSGSRRMGGLPFPGPTTRPSRSGTLGQVHVSEHWRATKGR